jgi:hypothetical protein
VKVMSLIRDISHLTNNPFSSILSGAYTVKGVYQQCASHAS